MSRSANLILHHRIPNILDQTTKFTRILSIGEKPFNSPLCFQWAEVSEDILEFPINPRTSDSMLILGEHTLTVLASVSFLPP